jgi:hypothetical protein
MSHKGKVRVWKQPGTGFYLWECERRKCQEMPDDKWSGGSIFWEIAQRAADEHAREWHRPRVGRDVPTPPGGTHFDWSDTGMHVRIRSEDG